MENKCIYMGSDIDNEYMVRFINYLFWNHDIASMHEYPISNIKKDIRNFHRKFSKYQLFNNYQLLVTIKENNYVTDNKNRN